MSKDKPIVISFVNQKGGVGKTTSTFNVSCIMADAIKSSGKKILTIDFDPQSNLTKRFYPNIRKSDPTLYHEILNVSGAIIIDESNRTPFDKLIKPTYKENLDILPTTLLLGNIEAQILNAGNREAVLRTILVNNQAILKNYEYILIDCPPSQGLLALNAIVASDYVMIPVEASEMSTEGLDALLDTLAKTRQNHNSQTRVLGVFMTMCSKGHKSDDKLYKELKSSIGTHFWDESIHRYAVIKTATNDMKRCVVDVEPSSKGATDYLKLANRILKETKR